MGRHCPANWNLPRDLPTGEVEGAFKFAELCPPLLRPLLAGQDCGDGCRAQNAREREQVIRLIARQNHKYDGNATMRGNHRAALYCLRMASILLVFSRTAKTATTIIVSTAMNTMISGNDSGQNPIDELTRQHKWVFAGYMVLLGLMAIFSYWVWSSGNRVQEAIRKDADVRIAGANERAAEANRLAEQERLARIRIEERIAGWRLEPDAEERLIEKLKPYAKTPIDLSVNPNEIRFMRVIDRILEHAGWTRHQPRPRDPVLNMLLEGKAEINYEHGIFMEVAQERWNDFGPAFTALVQGLVAEGIPARGHIVTQGSAPSAIHILIGNRE